MTGERAVFESAIAIGAVCEVLPAWTPDGPHWDEVAGVQATVIAEHGNGDVEIRVRNGGEYAITRRRLRRVR